MLLLTELRLPIDHAPEALPAAIIERLKLGKDELVDFTVFKRSHDARQKDALMLIYIVDLELKNEAAVFKRFAKDNHIRPTPDMSYKFVTQAPALTPHRPGAMGFGPR